MAELYRLCQLANSWYLGWYRVSLHCNYERCGLRPKRVDYIAHPRV